jgi:hypothetical protein
MVENIGTFNSGENFSKPAVLTKITTVNKCVVSDRKP